MSERKSTKSEFTANGILHPAFNKTVGTMSESRSLYLYDSISAFVESGSKPHEQGLSRWKRSNESRPDFYGCTFTEAMSRVKNGWPEAVAEIESLISDIPETLKPKTRKRKKKRGDFGEEYDIHAAWGGSLDTAWSLLEKREVHGPNVITLAVEVSDSYSVDQRVLFWRGAATLALTDMLEGSGYSVEIVTCFVTHNTATRGKSAPILCQVLTKESSQPVDLSALAGSVANPAFFRVNFFRWACCQNGQPVNSSIGRCSRLERHAEAAPATVIVKGVTNSESACRFINDAIGRITEASGLAA